METIIQWNCRGLRANLEEVELLMKSFSPSILCLQETLLNKQDVNFRQYTAYLHLLLEMAEHTVAVPCLLKRRHIVRYKWQSVLQAVAARISLFRPVTVCSIYLPPSSPINLNDLDALLVQLPSPIILLGVADIRVKA